MSSGAEGLLDRVRAVVPLIAERAASAEAARQPDDDVIQALRDTGVFKAFVSKRYGGYELDLVPRPAVTVLCAPRPISSASVHAER